MVAIGGIADIGERVRPAGLWVHALEYFFTTLEVSMNDIDYVLGYAEAELRRLKRPRQAG